ncbi:fluoride efflux transporter FluC [Sandaracinobacteroides sayramensis]|uniref:fluoride efflux transporter FluC n=1 Tax=Sandaracinobacteroides sayramensis TaxID=2913411 RepID=UPI002105E2F5|nr:CrcB family protein [Sandaracinobacteroides sayramensis]
MNFLLVGLGGALGSMARYGFYRLLPPPLGTMGVNISGGLLMGVMVGWLMARGLQADGSRLFIGMGVLGGFTTFSAFSLDVVQMIERGAWGQAAGYALGSTVLSVAALFLGLAFGRWAA